MAFHKLEFPEFPTHARLSKSGKKYKKINGQQMYSGMNHFTRVAIVNFMHNYFACQIPKGLVLVPPVSIELEFHAPINYGDVRLLTDRKTGAKRVSWKKPKSDYKPTWDSDNQWIWGKCFNDTLVELGILDDDNISIVKKSGGVEWIEVDDLAKRKLVFNIYSK